MERQPPQAAAARCADLREIVDEGHIDGYRVCILALMLAACFADGYDAAAISYGAPLIARAWHVPKVAMTPVFVAGILGAILGSGALGILSDRVGRRPVIIGCVIAAGAASFATCTATGVHALIAWRFATGISIGALPAVCMVMAGEFAPERYRATAMSAILLLVSAGGAGGAGVVSTILTPTYGWPTLFWSGGAISIVLAIALLAILPESIKYLYLRHAASGNLRVLAARLAPAGLIGRDTILTWTGEIQEGSKAVLRPLFSAGLRIITPVLWLGLFWSQGMAFALMSWLPTFLETARVSQTGIAYALTLFELFGLIGGMAMARGVDRYGLSVITLLPLIGLPMVALVSLLPNGSGYLVASVAFSGVSVVGTVIALAAVSGLLYPTALRSTGVGTALFVARFGAIIGLFSIRSAVGHGATVQAIFLAAAVPLTLSAAMCWLLARAAHHSKATS